MEVPRSSAVEVTTRPLVERRHGSNGVRGLGVGIDPLSDDGIVPVNARDHVHGDTSTEHGGDAGVPEVV